MNYKVMKRPMFRLGGDVRRNYENGTSLEDLIKQRGELRQKRFQTQRSLLPFSVLASQMDDIRTIRKPGDVLNILSNIGGSPELLGALSKLPTLELDKSTGDLKDKIALAKIKKGKEYEYRTRLADAKQTEEAIGKILRGRDRDELTPEEQSNLNALERKLSFLYRDMSRSEYVFKKALENPNVFDIEETLKEYEDISKRTRRAEGGRIGYQEGTPEPMMQEIMQPAAPKENTMSVKQMYDLMRQRIPQANVSDKDLYKIASSEQIMADFASLETMSDVTQFNEQYDTNIVLDLPIVG